MRSSFSDQDVAHKLDREPVTVADYVSQALITSLVVSSFPEDGFIAEEGAEALRGGEHAELLPAVERWFARATDGYRPSVDVPWLLDYRGGAGEVIWAIDPIDGTKGFLRGDQYAVAIGLLVGGRPVAGVLACPEWPGGGSVFFGRHGAGSWRQSTGDPVPIEVSKRDAVSDLRILASVESAHGDPTMVRRVREILGIAKTVRVDSQAKYCFVASGGAEIYLRPRSRPGYQEKIWDHAAGVALVEAAGGRVSDIDGKPLDFSQGSKLTANRGVLATHDRLHEVVVDAIRQAES